MTIVLADGITPSGRTLYAERVGDGWASVEFVIDGQDAEIVERPTLYRDGGTQQFKTARGVVCFPHRMGSDDRTPRLDGERVEPVPGDVLNALAGLVDAYLANAWTKKVDHLTELQKDWYQFAWVVLRRPPADGPFPGRVTATDEKR